MLKRSFDVVVASVGLVLLAPVFAAVALAVRLDAPGPVFYRGVRAGLDGRPFRIFKFRTMVPDAERVGGGSTAKNDPRVTRVGAVLRRHKLDELPQFMNVLLGDMSLVGPRPELLQYAEQYSAEEREILSVRPGITDPASLRFIDLAEVLGSEDADRAYEETVLAVKNRLRLEYVRSRTFGGDLRLLLTTAWAVLSRMAQPGRSGRSTEATHVAFSER
jgi:lipopolysaccharide/colanic/teichoic acid biosynthesis glycosyltransferase